MRKVQTESGDRYQCPLSVLWSPHSFQGTRGRHKDRKSQIMEVTTSRKPAPALRTFSKDIAFSLGGRYSPRGKAGLGDVIGSGRDVLIVSKSGRDFLIEVYHDGEPVYDFLFSSFSVTDREDSILKGLKTGNQIVYDNLNQYLNVQKTEDSPDMISFDGVQRRRYVLRLKIR